MKMWKIWIVTMVIVMMLGIGGAAWAEGYPPPDSYPAPSSIVTSPPAVLPETGGIQNWFEGALVESGILGALAVFVGYFSRQALKAIKAHREAMVNVLLAERDQWEIDLAHFLSKRAVLAIEQMGQDWTGKEKLDFVKEFVNARLAEKGFNVDPQFVRVVIESLVQELPK